MWRLGCAGAIIRSVTGTTAHIKAAMLLADLRGFGRLTDELLEERIIELSQCLLRVGQIIRDVLAGSDYEIMEAEDGEQALAAVAKQRPDLIPDGYPTADRGRLRGYAPNQGPIPRCDRFQSLPSPPMR